jgi:cardiolipin synthase
VLRHLVPNGLSAARLLLGLAFPFFPASWRAWAVAAAAASDALDGLAARWLRAESLTGRLLDPAADKAFVLVLAGTFVAEGAIHPLWAVGLAARDFAVLGGAAAVALRRRWASFRRMRPTRLGKCATWGQFAVLLALVVRGSAPAWLLAAAALLSVAAATGYAWEFRPKPR